MSNSAGPAGTHMGATAGTTPEPTAMPVTTVIDPVEAARRYEAAIAERRNAPRDKNVFIPVAQGGQRPSGWLAAMRFGRSLKADPHAMPTLSPADIRKHAEYWERRMQEAIDAVEKGEYDRLVRRLQLLVTCGVRGPFTNVNGKSIGKTRIIQLVLATLALHTGSGVFGMTSTLNNATATLSRMSDLTAEERLAVEEFAEKIDTVSTPAELEALIPKTRTPHTHVGIIGEGKKTAGEESTYDTKTFIKTVLELLYVARFVGLDTGNDGVQGNSVALWAMRLAVVPLLVLDQNDAVTTGTFLEDVKAYRTDVKSGENLDRTLLDAIKVCVKYIDELKQSAVADAMAGLKELGCICDKTGCNEECRTVHVDAEKPLEMTLDDLLRQLDVISDQSGGLRSLYVATWAKRDLINRIQETERTTREDLTGLHIETRKKLAKAVVVCNRADEVRLDGVNALMALPPSVEGDKKYVWQGKALPVRLDPWLLGKSSDFEPNPGILDKLLPETRMDVLRVTVALLEAMADLLDITVPDTDKDKPIPVVDKSK